MTRPRGRSCHKPRFSPQNSNVALTFHGLRTCPVPQFSDLPVTFVSHTPDVAILQGLGGTESFGIFPALTILRRAVHGKGCESRGGMPRGLRPSLERLGSNPDYF